MDGIKDRRGQVLDYGAGLARASVYKGLKNLIDAEAISVRKSKAGNHYQINLHMDVDKVVQLVNQFAGRTKSGSASRPKLVHPPNPQNLGNKEKSSIRDSGEKLSTMTQELVRKMTINQFNH